MKNISFVHLLLFSLLSLSLLSSCTEVIDIPLEDADRKVVVQASLYNVPGFSQVVLMQSGSFYEPGDYPLLSDAAVTISDEEGNSQLLEETQAGVYSLPSLIGKEGMKYQLDIEYNGENFQSGSLMKSAVQIDSVSFEMGEEAPFREAGYVMQVHFTSKNPSDTYLKFRLLVNDTLINRLYLYDGSLPRGGAGQYSFLTASFQKGDRIQIITESLDKEAFSYFDQLSELTGDAFGPPSAAPANPKSNLSGGALGYFAAVAASLKEVVVP